MLSFLALVLLAMIPVGHHTPAPRPRTPAPAAAAALAQSIDLFSRRTRRRAAMMLRLRWEDLRLADVERARAAIRRQLPIDELLKR